MDWEFTIIVYDDGYYFVIMDEKKSLNHIVDGYTVQSGFEMEKWYRNQNATFKMSGVYLKHF